ncbi:ABC transporter ATP-binding protein [bacterium]|nr:MAG: ABC transporter ATP-binding protein [bacterium]
MKSYWRIFPYIKRFKKNILLSILMSVLFSIFSAASVYLTIPLLKTIFLSSAPTVTSTDSGSISGFYESIQKKVEVMIFEGGKENALLIICILILIAFLLKNLTGFLQSIYITRVEEGVLKDLRNELYSKINSLSIRYFTQEKTGNLISRMTNDLNVIQSGISAAFSNLIKDPLLILIFLILSLSISWQMTLISFTVFPLTLLIVTRLGSSLRRRSIRVQQKMADLLTIITETIYGAKIIRAFRAEKLRDNIFFRESQEHYRLTMRTIVASELASPISEFLTIVAGVIIIWFGGKEILINKTLKPEDFLGFLFILFQLLVPIKNLSTVNNRIQKSSASGDRVFEILDHPVEIYDSADAVAKDNFDNDIVLNNVSFHYDENKTILSGINLKINKSEIVAVVGASGAGKSTLADLIARFYDVSEGNILLDGFDIQKIKTDSLRKLISIVPQETILFNDTIRSNILFGLENVSEQELSNAAKFANAHDFIMDTEKGYETITGERGLRLSGGQKQRIAIARALLRNPQILILDEATSSLDTESENLVQEALEKLMHNRTSIVIAHRLSTVRNADRIVVLDEGKIVQEGTHNELVAKNGVYKKLYELQFKN